MVAPNAPVGVRGKSAARAVAAALAVQGVQPVLGHRWLDLRQLRHLMAQGTRVLATQPPLASSATGRLAVHHGLHLLQGEHLASMPLVPGLSTRLAPRRRLALALDRRRVARRRLARIARRRGELLLQLRDALLQPGYDRLSLRVARQQLGDQGLQLGDLSVARVVGLAPGVPHPQRHGKSIRRPACTKNDLTQCGMDPPRASYQGLRSNSRQLRGSIFLSTVQLARAVTQPPRTLRRERAFEQLRLVA